MNSSEQNMQCRPVSKIFFLFVSVFLFWCICARDDGFVTSTFCICLSFLNDALTLLPACFTFFAFCSFSCCSTTALNGELVPAW